ncbi:MAG: class I SAM-dependent methyltransferase [Candidatus Dormibacteraeota bacterium]|nr:class I SAM-dependent methyltransferase [Candidatus Dormibacteraeota bacterium]
MEELHRALGTTLPCSPCAQFRSHGWSAIFDPIAAQTPTRGYELDADTNLALAVWVATYHVRPAVAVETGVARGLTSATILSAMENRETGHLYSIDLPPLTKGWAQQSRTAVSGDLQHRWSYVRGATRRKLPGLLARLKPVDLFVHDSLHTYDNMRFELESAWPALRAGGVLIADDIQDNRAFDELVAGSAESRWIVGPQCEKPASRWGLVVKGSG